MSPQNASSPTYSSEVARAAAMLQAHQGPFVVLAHENPDGDALGSVLGLTRALRALGRTVIAPMEVPRYLSFVVQDRELSAPLFTWPTEALAVVLDVDNNDHSRVAGAQLEQFRGPVINLDHHGTNQRRATAGVVDPSKAAAAHIVTDVLEAMNIPWSEEVATPLFLGLKTDTGNFSFDSVTPETLTCAAKLRGHGARLGWLNDELGQHPPSYYRLLREVLGELEFLHDGRVIMAHIDQAMLDRAKASWEEVESYVSLLRNAQGSQLAVMIKDFGDQVKLSLRSRGPVSAQNIALSLGGGGHIMAAGAACPGPYAAVRQRLETAIAQELLRVGHPAS